MRTTRQSFSELKDEFIYTSLSFSPVAATSSAGYHRHQGVNLDQQLDDFSDAAIERQKKFYDGIRYRFRDAMQDEKLSAEDSADYEIIRHQIDLALLEFNEIQNYRHNPTVYVELIGNALFNPLVLEYAPKPDRMRDIIARIEKIPAFFDQAKKNLAESPDIWTKVAGEENQGNINLLERTLPAAMPPELRSDFDRVAQPALAAVRGFGDYIKNDLAKRNRASWRLGEENYRRKFGPALAVDSGPSDVLEAAESQLKQIRGQMLELALPLHAKMLPGHTNHTDLSEHDRQNRIISEVLERIAQRHATPEAYFAEAKRDLEEAREFVRSKNLLTLSPRANLQVIPTPEFMRGIYSVGGFNAAPALEPQLGAFYWVTPIPKDWPPERIESKLREYNVYHLKLLTIHEAMPGHYVQFEFANDVEPRNRRLLRALWGPATYVEGWAVYAEQMMLDEGYLNNAPELRLTFQKEMLRVAANAILDVRLQMEDMTDQQALDLMQKETFQETEEATAKLQRAKLSSCQLPTYFAGWRNWLRIRDAYQKARGSEYRLTEFHNAALKEGAVPLPALARLLTGKGPDE
ncbi:MAG TPA: DUF885 domain-containing protein [Bryobacteraceae bacterium]|nr:DUF885 domain-containing protein [Bryobacteraceae bacterium]